MQRQLSEFAHVAYERVSEFVHGDRQIDLIVERGRILVPRTRGGRAPECAARGDGAGRESGGGDQRPRQGESNSVCMERSLWFFLERSRRKFLDRRVSDAGCATRSGTHGGDKRSAVGLVVPVAFCEPVAGHRMEIDRLRNRRTAPGTAVGRQQYGDGDR